VTANGLNALGSTLNNGNALRFYRAGLVEMGYIGWSNENANNSTWLFKSSNGNPIGFSADGTNQQLFVNISGNVGIGTTDPSRLLHILAPTGNHAYGRIEGGSGGYGGFLELMANSVGSGTDSAGKVDFYMTSTNRIATIDAKRTADGANYGTLIFSTANNATTPTERMRITSGGNVEIGKALNSTLTVENDGTFLSGGGSASTIRLNYGGITIVRLANTGTGNRDAILQLSDEGTVRVNISANNSRGGDTYFNGGGNVGIGTATPDTNSRLDVNGQAFVARLAVYNNSGTPTLGTSPMFYSPASGTLAISTNASERMRISSDGSATFTGPITNNHGALYSQSTLFLNKLVNVGDNTTTTVLTISQDGAYSQIGGGEILIVFVDNGSPWGVYVWKGLISVRTVQFGAMYGTGIQEISSRNNLDGSISVICTTTKTGGVADAVTRVQITTGSGIAGTAHVSFNGWIQGGSQPV
jgi:hypothetical protein